MNVVTVDVDSDDILDVLAWREHQAGHTFQPANFRWLSVYQKAATKARRNEIWRSMPASLAWVVHEVEQRGTNALRAVLTQMAPADTSGAAAPAADAAVPTTGD